MKKLVSMIMVLVLMLTGAAFAEEVTSTITLSILNKDGSALTGANVTVYDAANMVAVEYVSSDMPYVMEGVAEGTYTVCATDPTDGFTAVKTFYADIDQTVELVIRKLQVGTKAVVGTLSRPTGEFFTDMWGNNTTDDDVRALIHGLSTVSWTMERQYGFDPTIVAEIDAGQQDDNKIYTITLSDNLAYSDGTPITAADYVFSVLLQSSKEMAELGAKTLTYSHLVGYERYLSGEAKTFKGVRLVNDKQFELHIEGAFLPYFYELMYASVTPYPIHVIAPGCEVRDDGNGAYIEGDFTAALLEKTVLDPETGYLSHPSVVSGPYMLTSYDAVTGNAQFKVNPYYPGNYQGVKPVIESIELREVKYSDALDLLASGEIDVINKATEGAFIDAGLASFGKGEIGASNYMRTGYGFLAFACEERATESVKVRQAMAHCFDKQNMIEDFLNTYGLEVHSYYGLGQWMAQPYASSMSEYVTVYPKDLKAAVELLEEDGWVLNAEGGEYAAGEGAVRYKKDENGHLIPLEIRFAKVKNNKASQWIVDYYAPVLAEVGFDFKVTEVTFDELLAHYYRQEERTYNLMYLATNFAQIFDPYFTFNTDEAYQGTLNTSGIADKKLMDLAYELRATTPGDEDQYSERWLDLMKHYSDLLPTLPIYSNVYYDFFATDLMDYAPNAHWAWASAIIYSYMAE